MTETPGSDGRSFEFTPQPPLEGFFSHYEITALMKSPEVLSDSEQFLQSGNAGFPVTVGKGSSSVLNFLKFGTEYQINVWSVTENGEKSFQSTEANVITSELPIF